MDARYRRQAFENMTSNLGRLPVVMLIPAGRTWGIWKPAQQRTIDYRLEGRGSIGLLRVMQWS